MAVTYPFAGAVPAENGACSFTVWAPDRKKVSLSIADPVPVVHSMTRDEQGYWQVQVPGVPPGTRYRYLLDDELERPDPASRVQPEGVHGPSAVPDLSFNWQDDEWYGMETGQMILYELHVGAFSPQGNFDGVIAKLDYLKSLGVNAIELMPVAQFPGTRNWGYDMVYPFAVQHSYGGIKGLKALVNAAHRQGIAVILDVVYNHLGPEGNYFPDYGPYFTDKYKTPWGPAINFDDARCDGVRGYYLQNALMWLDEFHIDGLRLDAVHAIWDCGARHFMEELSEAVAGLQQKTGRHKILIAEIDYNSPRYILPREKGGYGLHAQWIDEFHHALHAVLTGERNGYYADFGGLSMLAKAFRDSYVYTGQYSEVRRRRFGVPVPGLPYSQFIAFIQNHDQTGNRMLGERLSALLPFEAQKLAAAILLLSPHVPLLFMGEEYGEKNPFLYFTSHSDPTLIAALRKGRQEEFANFAWEGEAPDPQAEATFRRSMPGWSTTGTEAAALLEFYRYLIAFRRTRTALQNMERSGTLVFEPEDEQVLAVERYGNQDALLLLFNCSGNTASWQYRGRHTLLKKLDSSAAIWHGPGACAPDEAAPGSSITLHPYTAIVYEIV